MSPTMRAQLERGANDVWTRPRSRYTRTLRIAAVAVVSLIVIVAAFVYIQAHQDKGVAPTGTRTPQACRLDEQTLQRARTSNPMRFEESDSGDEKYAVCGWAQTKGKDGIDPRSLSVTVQRYTGPTAERDARASFVSAKSRPHAVEDSYQTSDAPGIPDEAAYQTAVGTTDSSVVTLIARRANTVVEVTYSGADQGFFWTTPMPAAEGRELTATVMNELLSRP